MITDFPGPERHLRLPLLRLVASLALSFNDERTDPASLVLSFNDERTDPALFAVICRLRTNRTAEALSQLFSVEVDAINMQPMQMQMQIIKDPALGDTEMFPVQEMASMFPVQEMASIVMGQRAILNYEESDLLRWRSAGLIEDGTSACSPRPCVWLTDLLKRHTPLTAPVEIDFTPRFTVGSNSGKGEIPR